MRCLLSVCFAAFTLLVIARTAAPKKAQTMQQGISVQLAVTGNATPMPQADYEDAWIVTVTDAGRLYFGVHPVTLDSLIDAIKRTPRNREAKLYIKADARTPYANVEKVLDAGRTLWFAAPVLLTSQAESLPFGTVAPPKGLEVLVGQQPTSPSPEVTIIAVLNSGQRVPTLKINDQEIPWPALKRTLQEQFQNRTQNVASVTADGLVPFAHVVQVVDACRGMGAQVVLVTPEQQGRQR